MSSMQALKVTDLEDKVSQLNAQLATESGERQAAEATVLDLITLHLQVSELRERLAHEMQAGTELKVKHSKLHYLLPIGRYFAAKQVFTVRLTCVGGSPRDTENHRQLARRSEKPCV